MDAIKDIKVNCIVDGYPGLIPMTKEMFEEKLVKAQNVGMDRALADFTKKQYTEMLYAGQFDEISDKIRVIRELTMKNVDQCMWLTISPPPDCNASPVVLIRVLMKKVKAYCTAKLVKNSAWCFEQRGETEDDIGTGVHAHMIIEFHKKPFKSDFDKKWKTLLKNTYNSRPNIHIQQLRLVPNRITYLLKTKHKDTPRCQADDTWRQKYNIEPIYFHGDWSVHTASGNYEEPDSDSDVEMQEDP